MPTGASAGRPLPVARAKGDRASPLKWVNTPNRLLQLICPDAKRPDCVSGESGGKDQGEALRWVERVRRWANVTTSGGTARGQLRGGLARRMSDNDRLRLGVQSESQANRKDLGSVAVTLKPARVLGCRATKNPPHCVGRAVVGSGLWTSHPMKHRGLQTAKQADRIPCACGRYTRLLAPLVRQL